MVGMIGMFADVAAIASVKLRQGWWVGQSIHTISIDLPLSRS